MIRLRMVSRFAANVCLPRIFFAYVFLLFASGFVSCVALAEETDVVIVNDTEINIDIHRAKGDLVAIWLPSEAGPQPADEQLAADLADLGIEVWRVDLVEAQVRIIREAGSS